MVSRNQLMIIRIAANLAELRQHLTERKAKIDAMFAKRAASRFIAFGPGTAVIFHGKERVERKRSS